MALQQQFPKIDSVFSIFLLDQRAQGHTDRTIGYYRGTLGRFFAWLDEAGVENIDQVTSTYIRTYLATLQERGLAGHTVHGAASAIRAFFQLRCAGRDH